ncbi:50S ribosomal protein L29, chloroplastic-like [Raphanus sativus]|uniref:50S ribosomal protein L29, chloroplastic n=1 Tax=Raphanus sativus TaxID=3726 RepID=A0A6J0JPV4_RAPSA|nr:50S ribosomal protein L29, chloroplastic [Raphanus sativus]XP_056843604.1 50S ribosomal protein L29, chloroplastic-like [Raphanus sativus]
MLRLSIASPGTAVTSFRKASSASSTSSSFHGVRINRQVARILTVRREREMEEGIGKRLSRKLDRQWKKSIVVRPPPSLKKLQEEEAAEEAAEAA